MVVDGSRRPSPAMAEHLRSCLSCQAELAGYRRLLRVLRSLRDEQIACASPPLTEDAWRAIAQCVRSCSRANGRWRLAGAAAIAVGALAVAALGGGAVLARASRQSRLVTATAGAA